MHAGKRKCNIRPVNKVEICFPKIAFLDCEESNLNVPPLGAIYFWGPTWVSDRQFLCMQEKEYCIWLVDKVEIYFEKNRLCRLYMVKLKCPRAVRTPLGLFPFWDP